MSVKNPYQAYQTQAVTTSRPEDLTYMLYQGLGKFIRLSKHAVTQGNLSEAHTNNMKAQDILTELMVTLKPGFDISESLSSMYDYMKRRLIEANIKKDLQILEEVESLSNELAEAWAEAIKQGRK